MLLNYSFGAIRLAHVSLIFAGLMWVLPFLYSRHVFPLPGFYQEWGAAMLGLLAMLLLATRRFWQQPEIPRIVLLPIGLSLLVMVQFAAGKVAYLDQALLFALYMLWAALLTMLGHRLREELGLPVLCTALAACLLLGAELNALVGVLQHYFWCVHPDSLLYLRPTTLSGSLVGNLAQANHFADYITLGLVSLGLLHFRWQLRGWQVALLAAPLLFVLTLSGSRSPWLYLLCLAGMAFLWQRRERKGGCLRQDRLKPLANRLDWQATPIKPVLSVVEGPLVMAASLLRGGAAGNPPAYPLRVDKTCLSLLYYSLALLLGFGLMHFVVQIPWLAGCSGGLTSGERLIAEGGGFIKEGGGSARLYLWREAGLIFTQFPLLGAGFGQFAWQHFQLGPVSRNTIFTAMGDNAHNIVLQIAAEMGLAGLLVLLGTLALWFWQARTAQRTVYHWWGHGLLAVLAIHSLLEYPLWFAYFLGLAALTLGMFDTATYRLKRRGAGRLPVAAILLLGVLTMFQVRQGYRELERLSNFIPPADVIKKSNYNWQPIRDRLVALQGEMQAPLLRPHVESVLVEAGWNHVADKGALNERVMRYAPGSSVVYRQGWLLARAGRQAEARAQIERAIWAYPDDFPAMRDKLRALADADTDPSRFPVLLEFALQKYEERQRAANTQ